MILESKTILISVTISLSELFLPGSVISQSLKEYKSPTVNPPVKTNLDYLNVIQEEVYNSFYK